MTYAQTITALGTALADDPTVAATLDSTALALARKQVAGMQDSVDRMRALAVEIRAHAGTEAQTVYQAPVVVAAIPAALAAIA